MTLALITAKQVIVLFILIFSGFICVKTGAVKIEGRKAFSDLLVYFVVPCMIINSYLTEFDDNIFKNILYALGLSILLLVVGFAITFLLSFKLNGDNVPIVRFGCMFSNAAYMGFPLIQALFGSEGLIYASAFVTAFNIFLWTLGYSIVSRTFDLKAIVKKIFTTPAIISVFIGLLIFIAEIPLPVAVEGDEKSDAHLRPHLRRRSRIPGERDRIGHDLHVRTGRGEKDQIQV